MKSLKMIQRCLMCLLVLWIITTPSKSYGKDLFPQTTGFEGKVLGTRVNVRDFPNINSDVIMQVSHARLRITATYKEWYQVEVNGREGWIYKDYIKTNRPDLVPTAKILAEEVVAYGMKFLGTPYVWGGSDLYRGVDCSGFTQEIFDFFEIDISRVSYMQANDGETVPKSQLRRGDLVFFDTTGINDGKVSHVGIYIGEDQFIHADGTNGVMVSRLSSPYYTRNYVKAVRIIES